MTEQLHELIDLLDLEQVEVNLFRGHSPDDNWQRVFGGQVIGQALVAASRTVEDVVCHSLHAYFLRPGDPNVPIVYEVDRARDGKSFKSRRVTAIQHGKQIFNLAASFQSAEDGLAHQVEMPYVPPPEDLQPERERRLELAAKLPEEVRNIFTRKRPVEIRHVQPIDLLAPAKTEPVQQVWFKASEAGMPEDLGIHQCVLAYMSDMTLLDTCLRPHGVNYLNPKAQIASLDHAMWFHRPFRADDWMLYTQSSPASSGGRGLNFGHVFTRDGTLVCSMSQEGLIRLHD
ncbi:MAG: acyl-CoA thioesterase II [Rhizobiales bacterium TMED83]|nr:acyl-CoA thioesterase II [Rhodobiaceae bacterium]RPF92486.1 MAG: acyl-CoA thioesterase II [Rhizobiales bacterium TMED83]